MRFQLLRRAHRHGVSTSVSGPGLKSWLTPKDPTLGTRPGDTWIVKHPVVELAAPAYYRFKVTFRWLGSSGQVLGQTSRRSKLCAEPGADLKMVKGRAESATPGHYDAVIQNVGSMKSSPFTVQVTDDSPGGGVLAQSPQPPYPPLIPGAKLTVSLTGVACHANDMLNITVIPAGSDNGDNPTDDTFMATCPTPTTTSTATSTALKRRHRAARAQGLRGR
jgi:hypothetical protein